MDWRRLKERSVGITCRHLIGGQEGSFLCPDTDLKWGTENIRTDSGTGRRVIESPADSIKCVYFLGGPYPVLAQGLFLVLLLGITGRALGPYGRSGVGTGSVSCKVST